MDLKDLLVLQAVVSESDTISWFKRRKLREAPMVRSVGGRTNRNWPWLGFRPVTERARNYRAKM